MEERDCPTQDELILLVGYSKMTKYVKNMLREEPKTTDAKEMGLYRNKQRAYRIIESWGGSEEEVKTNLREHLLDCPECFKTYITHTLDKIENTIRKNPEFRDSLCDLIKGFDVLNFFR